MYVILTEKHGNLSQVHFIYQVVYSNENKLLKLFQKLQKYATMYVYIVFFLRNKCFMKKLQLLKRVQFQFNIPNFAFQEDVLRSC